MNTGYSDWERYGARNLAGVDLSFDDAEQLF